MPSKAFFVILLLGLLNKEVCGAGGWIVCYRCNSNEPGCGTPFNWLLFWGQYCPEYNDVCVKLIERKGADTMITRDCLSNLQRERKDVPADHYEGCRPAAKDMRLGHYVNNSISQLEIHRDHYETKWCFCFLDNRCNSATAIQFSGFFILLAAFVSHFSS